MWSALKTVRANSLPSPHRVPPSPHPQSPGIADVASPVSDLRSDLRSPISSPWPQSQADPALNLQFAFWNQRSAIPRRAPVVLIFLLSIFLSFAARPRFSLCRTDRKSPAPRPPHPRNRRRRLSNLRSLISRPQAPIPSRPVAQSAICVLESTICNPAPRPRRSHFPTPHISVFCRAAAFPALPHRPQIALSSSPQSPESLTSPLQSPISDLQPQVPNPRASFNAQSAFPHPPIVLSPIFFSSLPVAKRRH
jgi:hypothetical protein